MHFSNIWTNENLEVSSVLEIGPGQGYFMREFKNWMPNLNYYVVESDPSVHDDLKRQGAAVIDASISRQSNQ